MILKPSQNPLFVEHPYLRKNYNRFELDALDDTDWLWQQLIIDETSDDPLITVKLEWRRMHYHGLAQFFTEIAICYAYWQTLVACGIEYSQTLLFHGNNVVLRIVSCWDRMGFCLNDRFDLGHPENDPYFGIIITELCSRLDIERRHVRRIRKLKEIFDKDAKLRDWRNKYLHRYGEYFSIENSGDIKISSFPNNKQRTQMVQELNTILEKSFTNIKHAMKLLSELFL